MRVDLILVVLAAWIIIAFLTVMTWPPESSIPTFKPTPTKFCTEYHEALEAAHANDPRHFYHVAGMDAICPN